MNHTRHIGLFDLKDLSVAIIGAGGIGAMTALVLAKMGVRYMALYDDDKVSEENLATQFHKIDHVGQFKVSALAATLQEFSDEVLPWPMVERIGPDSELICAKIIISCVDSITARKDIWRAIKNFPDDERPEWYLEARMGAEEFQLHSVKLASPSWYEEYLKEQSDETILDAPCTQKATFFCGAVAAGIIGATVRKITTGFEVPRTLVYNILNNFFITI